MSWRKNSELENNKGKKLRKLLKSIQKRLETASRAIDKAKKLDNQSKYFYMGKESAFLEIEKDIEKMIG